MAKKCQRNKRLLICACKNEHDTLANVGGIIEKNLARDKGGATKKPNPFFGKNGFGFFLCCFSVTKKPEAAGD